MTETRADKDATTMADPIDVSILHALTEDLASFLSEALPSDFPCAARRIEGDVGDLCRTIIEQNLTAVEVITGEPASPAAHRASSRALIAHDSAGPETDHRNAARLLEKTFASAGDSTRPIQLPDTSEVALSDLYEMQISTTILHTRAVARALDLPYEPAPGMTQRILKNMATWAGRAPASVPAPWRSLTTGDDVIILDLLSALTVEGSEPANALTA